MTTEELAAIEARVDEATIMRLERRLRELEIDHAYTWEKWRRAESTCGTFARVICEMETDLETAHAALRAERAAVAALTARLDALHLTRHVAVCQGCRTAHGSGNCPPFNEGSTV